ncbi:MAG: DUF2061 domain-containing protein [Gammaproteobacteria bacterium]|nr:DUF2061 domain-containing protein [Gammaproteobacteria bacterium]
MTTSTDMRESHLRSVLKAITYRIIGSITTGILAYAVTRDFGASLTITAIEPLIKTIVYYLHERAWQLIPRGFVRRVFRAH